MKDLRRSHFPSHPAREQSKLQEHKFFSLLFSSFRPMLFWQNRFTGLELQVKISAVNSDTILDFYLLGRTKLTSYQLAIPFVIQR